MRTSLSISGMMELFNSKYAPDKILVQAVEYVKKAI